MAAGHTRQSKEGGPPARSTKQEEDLLGEITAAMEGLSDEVSSADDDETLPKKRSLERRATPMSNMVRLPVTGGARRGLSLAGCGFALLFVYKLRAKYSPIAMSEAEVSRARDARLPPHLHMHTMHACTCTCTCTCR